MRIQYRRNDVAFERGTFRVRGDTVEVFPAYEEQAVRIELWGDEIERITKIDPLTGNTIAELQRAAIYPATHFVTKRPTVERAVTAIRAELVERLAELRSQDKLLEAQRLEAAHQLRHRDDARDRALQRDRELLPPPHGTAPGRAPGVPVRLLPGRLPLVVDESHVTLPQIGGMYNGDRSRKQTLVEYGFRLPSALDNRPLRFDEFLALVPRMLFVSATPGDQELQLSEGVVVEQIIRPTGLLDPEIEVRPVKGQVDDLLHEIRERARAGERVLVTTLTKRMAEDLDRLPAAGRRARALHALRHRRDRADGDRARPASRGIRRAGGHQSAARGARSAGGLAGGGPRCRPGRIPAVATAR